MRSATGWDRASTAWDRAGTGCARAGRSEGASGSMAVPGVPWMRPGSRGGKGGQWHPAAAAAAAAEENQKRGPASSSSSASAASATGAVSGAAAACRGLRLVLLALGVPLVQQCRERHLHILPCIFLLILMLPLLPPSLCSSPSSSSSPPSPSPPPSPLPETRQTRRIHSCSSPSSSSSSSSSSSFPSHLQPLVHSGGGPGGTSTSPAPAHPSQRLRSLATRKRSDISARPSKASHPKPTSRPHPLPKYSFMNELHYYGGPVLTSAINVYIIYYGSWTPSKWRPNADSGQHIIRRFINSLGARQPNGPGSVAGWWNVSGLYYNKAGLTVSKQVGVCGEAYDAYSQGRRISDDSKGIPLIVQRQFQLGAFTPTTGAVYFVLTSADVTMGSGGTGFCGALGWCGWHDTFTYTPPSQRWHHIPIFYGVIGNAATQCPASCGVHNVAKQQPGRRRHDQRHRPRAGGDGDGPERTDRVAHGQGPLWAGERRPVHDAVRGVHICRGRAWARALLVQPQRRGGHGVPGAGHVQPCASGLHHQPLTSQWCTTTSRMPAAHHQPWNAYAYERSNGQ